MRKVISVVLAVLFMFSMAQAAVSYGPEAIIIGNATGVEDIAVVNATTVYSQSFNIENGEYFGVAYRALNTTDPLNITIQLEQSWTTPATEGATDTNYVIPVGAVDIITGLTTNATWYIKSLSPVPTPYARFKIIGNSTNGNLTDVNIKLFKASK